MSIICKIIIGHKRAGVRIIVTLYIGLVDALKEPKCIAFNFCVPGMNE